MLVAVGEDTRVLARIGRVNVADREDIPVARVFAVVGQVDGRVVEEPGDKRLWPGLCVELADDHNVVGSVRSDQGFDWLYYIHFHLICMNENAKELVLESTKS